MGLTALHYHYATQCIPTPLSWLAHQLPNFIQKFSVSGSLCPGAPRIATKLHAQQHKPHFVIAPCCQCLALRASVIACAGVTFSACMPTRVAAGGRETDK